MLLFVAVEDEIQKQPLQMFFKIEVLKYFAIFTGKHVRWNNFFRKRLQRRYFPVKLKNRFFCKTPSVAVSWCLHYLLMLLFLKFFQFPIFLLMFANSHRMKRVFPSALIFLVKMITSIQKKKYKTNKKSTCF